MKFDKVKNLIISNILILISFLSFIELILGKWYLFNTPVTKIPAAPFARKIKRDVRKLYGLKKRHLITNIRDRRGYRKLQDYMEKPVILTIGGSTTAQTLVDEQHTWQSVMSIKLNNKFSVVNGGVSGQSAFGHLYSLENWHSKSFPKEKVKYIIFYFGVNDTKIYKSIPSFKEYESDAYANDRFWKIKSFLSIYSFFYAKLKEFRDMYSSQDIDSKNIFAYHLNSKRFGDIDRKIKIKGVNYESYFEYINLIKELSLQTKKFFPKSKVLWVQQSIPGCRFEDKKSVQDLHLIKSDICLDLAKVYLLQDYALTGKKNIRSNKSVIKMYLDNPLSAKGTYDFMHNNEIGSVEIGNYLYENIFKNLDL